MFFGRKITLICENFLENSGGCELTLSRKSITFLFCWASFRLVFVRTSFAGDNVHKSIKIGNFTEKICVLQLKVRHAPIKWWYSDKVIEMKYLDKYDCRHYGTMAINHNIDTAVRAYSQHSASCS